MTQMFAIATLETEHFSFQAYAEDTAKVLDLMRRAWVTHRKQTKAPAPWSEVEEDVRLQWVTMGAAYRDGAMVVKP